MVPKEFNRIPDFFFANRTNKPGATQDVRNRCGGHACRHGNVANGWASVAYRLLSFWFLHFDFAGHHRTIHWSRTTAIRIATIMVAPQIAWVRYGLKPSR